MDHIQIVEVGPRDGLQNEPNPVPTDVKIAFVEALADAGLEEIEVSSFVSPKWLPQLADADEVFARIRRRPGVSYSALVPNERGLERALRAKVDKIAVFTAASETFNRKNVNASIAQTLATCRAVVQQSPVPVRGYVSTAFWCPYEGRVAPERVAVVVDALFDLGCREISIGDTVGRAMPDDVEDLLQVLLARHPARNFAMHFHDTGGQAIPNSLRADGLGVRRFDACTNGLGGCPYAPGASGNVGTEALARAFGSRVLVDFAKLEVAAQLIRQHVWKS